MVQMSSDLGYLSAIGRRAPVLRRDEELELVRRFRDSRDRRAADDLVRAHLRLVIALAMKYRHYRIPLDELVAEGNFGLVLALDRFDPERGIRFGTYARHWARARILAYVVGSLMAEEGSAGLLRPRLFFKLRRERRRLGALLGSGDDAARALAERLHVSVEEAQLLSSRIGSQHVSLDAPGREEREHFAEELVTHEDPEQRYIRNDLRKAASSAIARAVKKLDERERFIAQNRLLVPDSDEMSLTAIGKAWGISRERVRQLELRARQKLERSASLDREAPFSERLG